MAKQFIKIVGRVSNDITVETLTSYIKQYADALTGSKVEDDMKDVIVEISVKELKDVV